MLAVKDNNESKIETSNSSKSLTEDIYINDAVRLPEQDGSRRGPSPGNAGGGKAPLPVTPLFRSRL